MITFALHGYEGIDPVREFGPLQAEFERRGFPCRIVRSPRQRTKTPNQDRATAMVEALRGVEVRLRFWVFPTRGFSCRLWRPPDRYGASC
jgi:hypothetical protein